MRYCTIGELDEDLAGMPETFLEEKLPPALVRDVCARRSLSQRAESAFKSWIMACGQSQQCVLESDRTTEAHGCQITVAGDVVALDDLTSLRVLCDVSKSCDCNGADRPLFATQQLGCSGNSIAARTTAGAWIRARRTS